MTSPHATPEETGPDAANRGRPATVDRDGTVRGSGAAAGGGGGPEDFDGDSASGGGGDEEPRSPTGPDRGGDASNHGSR